MQMSTIDLTESALVRALEAAYTARLAALVDGDDRSLTTTGRDVEDLECRWLERRHLHDLARPAFADTAYYLG